MPTYDNAIMRIVYYIHFNDDDDDNNNSLVGGRTGHLAGVLTGNVFRAQPMDSSKKKLFGPVRIAASSLIASTRVRKYFTKRATIQLYGIVLIYNVHVCN